MSGSINEPTQFKSKYGPIAILTTTTFNEWYVDCQSALAIMEANKFLEGTRIIPQVAGAARNAWDEKAREVLALINGSCSRIFKEECIEYGRNLDVKGLWDKLTSLNPNQNPHYINSLIREFHQVKFDPKVEKIQDVVNRLNHIRI
ncbi:hypothetical protein K3495_g12786 [Podosphaera aphanis]|nr:hypothetical protein K3495_g12786 [Podosphaera aphanis]